jgi:hypothetical protein
MSIRTIARNGKLIEVETLPDLPCVTKIKKQKHEPFLYEDMRLVILGLPAIGRVWVHLLRQRKMRPQDSAIAVSNKHLKELGVSHDAKRRAIETLRRKGLVDVVKGGRGRKPRVKLLV